MKGKAMLASLLCAVLLLGSFTACAEAAGVGRMTEIPSLISRAQDSSIYDEILQRYYDVLYADWYMPLTAEDIENMGLCYLVSYLSEDEKAYVGYYLRDINGDGIDELFIGSSAPYYIETIYQLYTVVDGEPTLVFTAGERDALYLRNDGTLLREGSGSASESFSIVYYLDDTGWARQQEGVIYDDYAVGGPYFLLKGEEETSVSEKQFTDAQLAYEKEKVFVSYNSLFTWHNGESASPVYTSDTGGKSASQQRPGAQSVSPAQPQSSSGSGQGYFSAQTLYDPQTGVPAAKVLVPSGWNTSLSVNWSFMSTSSPGVGRVTLQSPDGKAAICMISNQALADVSYNGTRIGEGTDPGLYMTYFHYRDAAGVQQVGLQNEGFGGAELVSSYPVADSILSMVQEAAQVKLQANIAALSTPIGCEGTAADKLYRYGNTYIEYYSLVTAARVNVNNGRVDLDCVYWNVPISFLFIADSRETYDQYRHVFNTVVANSDFTYEFLYVNIRYGAAIDDAIHAGLMQKSMEYILDSSGTWVTEAESSPDFDSSKFADQWSDVIYERDEYETADGSHIKVSTQYDTVYQDGDRLYMGPDAYAPDGWTKLNKTY